MIKNRSRAILPGVLMVFLMVLAACTASPAPKVQCDANLRPINSAHQQP